jgi:hypothetical protein
MPYVDSAGNLRHYGGCILDFDPVAELRRCLIANRRPPDGLLHPSGDLIGPLRHTMLTAANAPRLESDVVGDTRLMIGTLTHDWLERSFRSRPVMNEVKLTPYMPEGWSGTADAFFWNHERRGFVLVDHKTIKPEGIGWVIRDGMKDEHLWQASAYWWAAARMGIPLVNGFTICYWPTQQLLAREGAVQPMAVEGTPLPQEVVERRMAERWAATREYLNALPGTEQANIVGMSVEDYYINPALAPVNPRVQKLSLNTKLKVPAIDVKLAPHWTSQFCPFDDSLCSCSQQAVSKIGQWVRGEDGTLAYEPRANTDQPDAIERPSDKLIRALVKAQSDASTASGA